MGLTLEEQMEKIDKELDLLKCEIKEESKNREDFIIKLERKFREKAKSQDKEKYLENSQISAHFYNRTDNLGDEFEEEKKEDFNNEFKKIKTKLFEKSEQLMNSDNEEPIINIFQKLKKELLSEYEKEAKKKRENASWLNEYEESMKKDLDEYINKWINETSLFIFEEKAFKKFDNLKKIHIFMHDKYRNIREKSTSISYFEDNFIK